MKTDSILVHEWVTGGGLAGLDLPASWEAEGRAMRRALARDFASLPHVRVTITLDARLPDEPGPWSVARIGPGREPDDFASLAAEADCTVLIAPEAGGILADRTRILERAGSRSLGSRSGAIESAGDKLRLGALLKGLGIATPECRRVAPWEGLPADTRYPAVIKPVDGAGCIDTFLVPDAASLPRDAKVLSESLLQPFVPGVPMSASYLVGPGGRARLVGVGWQRMEVRDRRFVYRGGMLPAPRRLAGPEVRRAVESVAGLRGFVGVDFVLDEVQGEATILEINPRPTTSIVGLAWMLPPGRLARTWIDVVEGTVGEGAEELAEIIQSQDHLTFDADGTVSRNGERTKP